MNKKCGWSGTVMLSLLPVYVVALFTRHHNRIELVLQGVEEVMSCFPFSNGLGSSAKSWASSLDTFVTRANSWQLRK